MHNNWFDLEIYKAAFYDNWNSISGTFDDHPELRTQPINRRLETPLMIAVGTNRSHDFVKNLLSSLSTDDLISSNLEAENDEGDTTLHYAAKVGNMIDATLLVNTYSSNPLHKNKNGKTPLLYAAWIGGKKEMLDLLFSAADILNSSIREYPITDILTPIIDAEFLDIALILVERYSTRIWNSQRPLHVLARKPKLFISGSGLGFWGHLIYSLLPVDESKVIFDEKKTTQQHAHDEECPCRTCKCTSTTLWFKRILQYLASPIKNIYDMKLRRRQAKQLVKHICEYVLVRHDQDVTYTILVSTIATAIGFGNSEVIEECILAYPHIIWEHIGGSTMMSYMFHEALNQRQEGVYNLVYQMTNYKSFVASHVDHERGENALHIAAKLAPFQRLCNITGAALQMQRELQWFEEIRTFVRPSQKEALNKNGKTPRMIFSEEHKNLLEEGQKWMKETSYASSFVAALIVTMAFSAAFRVPGGDKNEGKIAFMIFIISDAIAFFSSATSVLMYLGILTSRYAEDDFLYMLPKRLTIGLVSLFLSLATTLIAFSATLALMLQDKVPGITVPLVIITSIPVVLFGAQQFPLLVELVYSTYGPSIFRKQSKRMIHRYKST